MVRNPHRLAPFNVLPCAGQDVDERIAAAATSPVIPRSSGLLAISHSTTTGAVGAPSTRRARQCACHLGACVSQGRT
jgi:hypothetical protein